MRDVLNAIFIYKRCEKMAHQVGHDKCFMWGLGVLKKIFCEYYRFIAKHYTFFLHCRENALSWLW